MQLLPVILSLMLPLQMQIILLDLLVYVMSTQVHFCSLAAKTVSVNQMSLSVLILTCQFCKILEELRIIF